MREKGHRALVITQAAGRNLFSCPAGNVIGKTQAPHLWARRVVSHSERTRTRIAGGGGRGLTVPRGLDSSLRRHQRLSAAARSDVHASGTLPCEANCSRWNSRKYCAHTLILNDESSSLLSHHHCSYSHCSCLRPPYAARHAHGSRNGNAILPFDGDTVDYCRRRCSSPQGELFLGETVSFQR